MEASQTFSTKLDQQLVHWIILAIFLGLYHFAYKGTKKHQHGSHFHLKHQNLRWENSDFVLISQFKGEVYVQKLYSGQTAGGNHKNHPHPLASRTNIVSVIIRRL